MPGTTRLVGRAAELADLEAERRRAATGCFRSVLMVAEPGVGKSRLAAELTARPRRHTLTLSARAHPLGEGVSFGVWAEALERHLRRLPPGEVLHLCGGCAEPLAGLLASVAAALRSIPARQASRLVLLEGLVTMLGRLAAATPTVVVLDDIHLADASSWEALDFIARNLPDSPLLVVATARPLELAEHPVAAEVAGRLEQDGLLRRLELRPLDAGGVAQLAEALLGEPPERALVSWLLERSQGNALFAVGLLHALVEEGADLTDPGLPELPEWLAERVASHVRRLPRGAVQVLEFLAVLGARVELDDLVRFCGKDLDELCLHLDRLVRARLVAEDERGPELLYEVAHPLMQDAIYQGLGGARRRALHRQLGRALLAGGRLGDAAVHFARSARPGEAEAVKVLCQAVRQAEEREAYEEVLTILDALVRVLPRGDPRWLAVADAMSGPAQWVVDHRADLHAVMGVRAMRQIDALLSSSSDASRRATIKFRLGNFLAWGTGELDEAECCYEAAAALFGEAGDEPRRWLAQNELAWVRGARGDLDAWESGAAEVVATAEASGDVRVLVRAVASLGLAQLLRGEFSSAEHSLVRSLTLAADTAGPDRVTWTRAILAWCLALEDRVADGLQILEEAKASDPAWRQNIVPEWETMLRYLAGDHRGALGAAREAAAANPRGASRRRAVGVVFAALAASEASLPDDARRYLHLAAAALKGQDWMFSTVYCAYGEAMVAWRAGAAAEALACLEEAATRILALEVPPFAALVLADLAEVAADVGAVKAAGEAAAEASLLAERLDRGLYRGLAGLATAWAALAGGERERAAAIAESAEATLSTLGYRVYAARAAEVAGRTALDPAVAVQHLETAAAAFTTAGAAWRRDRVLGALGRGARLTPGPGLGVASLSARERQVARLAAEGLTARQIAERLLIGRRTVETHLANAYLKLGLHSKAELYRRADELQL